MFYEHKAPRFMDVVKDFYANMVGMKDKAIYVRGKWIPFGREQIDQTYNLQERKNGSKFKSLVEKPDYEFVVMPFELTNAPTTFQGLMNDLFCEAPKPRGPIDQPSTYGIPMGIAYLDTTLSCLIHRDSFMSKSSPTGPFQPCSKYYPRLCHNSP